MENTIEMNEAMEATAEAMLATDPEENEEEEASEEGEAEGGEESTEA